MILEVKIAPKNIFEENHKNNIFWAIGSYLKMYQIKYNEQRDSLRDRKIAHKSNIFEIFENHQNHQKS